MAKVFIYTTLASNNIFRFFDESVNGLPVEKHSILIRGGAGIANEHFQTPKGVMTEIEESDYKLLEEHEQFKRMVEGGYIVVEKTKQEPDEVVVKKNMKKDKSAPLTKEDFPKDKAPKAAKEK